MNLTPEYAKILFGSVCLGLVISYAWWTRLRVVYFRQDLFEIRDHLWMVAKKNDALNDPAYQDARDVLNASIAAATFISLPNILYWASESRHKRKSKPARLNRSPIKDEVIAARRATSHRLIRYVLWDRPFSGLLLSPLLIPSYGGYILIRKQADKWLNSDAPFFLSRVASQA